MDRMLILNVPYYHIEASQNIFSVFCSKGLPILGEDFRKQFVQKLALDSSPKSDQMLEIQDFHPLRVQIWNRDGSQASMCGNGACALLYLAEMNGWLENIKKGSEALIIISERKCKGIRMASKGSYELDLGFMEVRPSLCHVSIYKERIPYSFVLVGNPHVVVYAGVGEHQWSLPEDFSMDVWGPRISNALRANFSLVHMERENEFRASFWELGTGETKACGSGALAIVKAFQKLFPEKSNEQQSYKVHSEGGTMYVRSSKGKLLLASTSSILGNAFFYMKVSD